MTLSTSFSDLQRFGNCKRSWYLGTYLGLRRKAEPRFGAMPFGTRIHLALETWGKSNWEADLIDIWKDMIDEEFVLVEKNGGFTKELSEESALGQIMLEGYLEWEQESGDLARWETVGVEDKLYKTLHLRLPTGEPVELLLRGKLDRRRVRKSDGAMFVDDYKTTNSLKDQAIRELAHKPQLPIYLMLEREQAPKSQWTAGGVFTMLRKVKRGPRAIPPFYGRFVMHVSDQKLEQAEVNVAAHAAQIAHAVNRLDAGEDHNVVAPYYTSWACKSCPFQAPCYEMQDGNVSGGEQMLDELYEKGDPFERYNESDEHEIVIGAV